MKLVILRNFSVRVIDRHGVEHRIAYSRGMVVDATEVPAGQSAENWAAKGLAKIAAGRPVA